MTVGDSEQDWRFLVIIDRIVIINDHIYDLFMIIFLIIFLFYYFRKWLRVDDTDISIMKYHVFHDEI